jgi:hypothetical protein
MWDHRKRIRVLLHVDAAILQVPLDVECLHRLWRIPYDGVDRTTTWEDVAPNANELISFARSRIMQLRRQLQVVQRNIRNGVPYNATPVRA